jgi:carbonic anhydrase/acetyltransferase-like protein (isoleucine patch superfamily)
LEIHPAANVSSEARIGHQCSIAPGVYIPRGVVLGDRVVVGANSTFVDRMLDSSPPATLVGDRVIIGAGAVIYPGIILHAGAYILPGAVVTRNVPHDAIVEGNPATIVGYINTGRSSPRAPLIEKPNQRGIEALPVGGVALYRFPIIPDLRGNLTVGEFEKEIPFSPKRYFMVYGVPSREIRGEHAHRACHQFLLCIHGSCAVVADDGRQRVEVILDAPNVGLYLPPMTWGIQYKYSADAILLVFASHLYDPADYIRSYDEFVNLTKKITASS